MRTTALALAVLSVLACVSACGRCGGNRSSDVDAASEPEDASQDDADRGWTSAHLRPEAEAEQPVVAPVEVPGLDALAHKPLVVVREPDPWATVLGADVPSFILYEDGLVIFTHPDGYREARLTPAAARAFADEILATGFASLAIRYECSFASDETTVAIYVRDGERWASSSAYGASRRGPTMRSPPRAFVDAYLKVIAFDPPDARPWSPEEIEIMLWGDKDAPSGGEPWPDGVPPPALRADAGVGEVSHYLDAKYEPRMRAFIDGPPHRTTVSVAGRTMWMEMRRLVPSDGYTRKVARCRWAHERDGGIAEACGVAHGKRKLAR